MQTKCVESFSILFMDEGGARLTDEPEGMSRYGGKSRGF